MAGAERRPFSNGVKPIHLVVLLLVVLFRVTYGGVDLRARRSADEKQLSDLQFKSNQFNPQSHANEGHGQAHANEGHGQDHGEGESHGEGHGYQVFHVEFGRVEIPFIIALWIFVSSLAKIGKIFGFLYFDQ